MLMQTETVNENNGQNQRETNNILKHLGFLDFLVFLVLVTSLLLLCGWRNYQSLHIILLSERSKHDNHLPV